MVTLGIDAHKRTHTVVAVDDVGRELGHKTTTATTSADHLDMLRWAERFGPERNWAVEDCRHLSRRLEADLLAAGERIVRVPPKLMAQARDAARTYGKSDPIDALAVARAALRHPDLPTAQLDGPTRELRLLVDHREDLVAERTRCINRLRWHLHELDPTWDPKATLADELHRTRRRRRSPAGASTEWWPESALEIVEDVRRITVRERALEREITDEDRLDRPQPPGHRRRRSADGSQDRGRGRRRPTVQVQGRLCSPQRHGTAAGVVGQPGATPPRPHRKPPDQRRHPPHCHHPGSVPRRRDRLPRPTLPAGATRRPKPVVPSSDACRTSSTEPPRRFASRSGLHRRGGLT